LGYIPAMLIRAAMMMLVLAAAGKAETFNLREFGRLEIFPVGEWKFGAEDVGELKIVIVPKDEGVNATAMVTVAMGGRDEYPDDATLARHLREVGQRMTESGEFAERKVTLKPIHHQLGTGYYFMFTDAKLAGKPVVRGDYKKICLGMIRLGPAVMVRLQILTDGEETEEFQQLLGMVEGMELHSR
jgi:hypothetical protein